MAKSGKASGASSKSGSMPKASDFNAPIGKIKLSELPAITGGSATEIADAEKTRKDLIRSLARRSTLDLNIMMPVNSELSQMAFMGTQQEKAKYAAEWAEKMSGGNKNLLPQKTKQITDTLNDMNSRGRRMQDVALNLPTSVKYWDTYYRHDQRYNWTQLEKYVDGKRDRPSWLRRDAFNG